MKQIETIGATREEAIQKALEELGVEMADVSNIEVIDEGSKGFLGLGSRPVKVRVTVEKEIPEKHQRHQKQVDEKNSRKSKEKLPPKQVKGKSKEMEKEHDNADLIRDTDVKNKPNLKQERKNMIPEQPSPENQEESSEKENRISITDAQGNEASALLGEMLQKMGIEASVKFVRTEDRIPKLEIESKDGALLIGRKGSHLETIQFLINRMFFGIEESDSIEKFIVDTENYLARRKDTLKQMALDFAEKVRRTGRKIKLSPMPSHERRIIHLTLQNDHSVETFSIGKGESRCVVIAPKNRRFDRRPRDNRDRRGHKDYRNRRNSRDYRNRYHDNRFSNNRQGGRRNSRHDWRQGRSNHSPYNDDINPGQVSD